MSTERAGYTFLRSLTQQKKGDFQKPSRRATLAADVKAHALTLTRE